MDLTRFNTDQRKALMELLVSAMYADGHLASAEDERINKVAGSLGLESDHERQLLIDATFTKVARLPQNDAGLKEHLISLVGKFPTRELRRDASQAVDELLRSDNQLASKENSLMVLLRQVFET
jgi:Tellurite resistance protein TerB